MPTPVRSGALLLILFCLITSCSQETGPGLYSFLVYEENGLTIAETTGGPKYDGEIFTYTEVLRLQQDESKPESLLNRPYGMTMGEDGSVFILDGVEQCILVFSADGSFRQRMGRRGAGPGEFEGAHYLSMYGDTLSVFDGRLRRTTLFSDDGNLLTTLTSPLLPPFLRALEYGPVGELISISRKAVTDPVTQENTSAEVVHVFSAGGDTLAILESDPDPVPETSYLARFDYHAIVPVHFHGRAQADYFPYRGIMMTNGHDPWINWYDLRGNLKRSIRIDLPQDPVTAEERQQILLNAEIDIQNAPDERARAIARKKREMLVIPDTKECWDGVFADEWGYLWATIPRDYQLRLLMSPSHRVFNPQGEYIGDTTWPEGAWSVSRGHLLMILDYETNPTPAILQIESAVPGLIYP